MKNVCNAARKALAAALVLALAAAILPAHDVRADGMVGCTRTTIAASSWMYPYNRSFAIQPNGSLWACA